MIAVHICISILVALGLAQVKFRRGVVAVLALVALAALVALVQQAGVSRDLELTHSFTAFDGTVVKPKDFVTGQVAAAGWQWPLVALLYCAGWAALLRFMKEREFHPFLGPIALAWSGLFVILAFEMSAAPEALVRPFAFDRVLLPAGIAAAWMLPRRCNKMYMTFCWLSVFVSAARLPIVVIGTMATKGRWANTSLDVHTMTHFANPLMHRPIEPAAGSYEQLGWLIWGPELIVVPALYMLSLSGIAFMATMMIRHPKTS